MVLFNTVERLKRSRNNLQSFTDVIGEILWLDHFTPSEDHCSFYIISQLSDIARPVIGHQ